MSRVTPEGSAQNGADPRWVRLATDMLAEFHGQYVPRLHARQAENLIQVLLRHTGVHLEMCSDEKTGRRFGKAKCRFGRCNKIGYTSFSHQVWAVWE